MYYSYIYRHLADIFLAFYNVVISINEGLVFTFKMLVSHTNYIVSVSLLKTLQSLQQLAQSRDFIADFFLYCRFELFSK